MNKYDLNDLILLLIEIDEDENYVDGVELDDLTKAELNDVLKRYGYVPKTEEDPRANILHSESPEACRPKQVYFDFEGGDRKL